MKYQNYEDFVNYRIRMSHAYQPVMLMTLLQNDGKASTIEIAKAIHKWCRYWDGSAPTLPVILSEIVQVRAGLSPDCQVGISVQLYGAGGYLRPHKQHPSRHRPTS